MTQRHRAGVGIVVAAGALALIAAGLIWVRPGGRASAPSPPRGAVAVPPDPRSLQAPEALAVRLRTGDVTALAELGKLLDGEAEGPERTGLGQAEAAAWLAAQQAMAEGYRKFPASGKATAQETTARVLSRFAVEPTPAGWFRILQPVHDVLAAGLAEPDTAVRVSALQEIGRLWNWSPGCPMEAFGPEEQGLAAWKQGLHEGVVRHLSDGDPTVRASAVTCLASLPIEEAAAPALPRIRDENPLVRARVLIGFGSRPTLLTEDDILPLLHDRQPEVRTIAEEVLKGRGLSHDQITLGKLICHPRPDLRASAIPLMLRRDDIDLVVWLLHLADDPDTSVRLKAIEALSGRVTPEVGRRLRELATSDESAEVRAAASRIAPPDPDRTVSLPPLPGSPSLLPRAN